MVSRRPEELCPGGDRASVVARKRGNARGVKGGRKVETLNESAKENNTVNVQWTQFGEEQKQVREPSTLVQSLLAAPVTGDNDCTNLEVQENASANLLASNHQLESRMQENCQSGLEGGAKPTFVPTPIATPKEPSRRVRCASRRCAHRFDDWSDEIFESENRKQRCYLAGTVHYINQQLEHHRTRNFREEYLN
jgi:hypothetical protein